MRANLRVVRGPQMRNVRHERTVLAPQMCSRHPACSLSRSGDIPERWRRACCSLLEARPADAGRGASWREKAGWAARSGASIGVSNRYDELAGGLAGFHVGVRLPDLTDIESTVHRHADLPCCHGIEKILKHGGR